MDHHLRPRQRLTSGIASGAMKVEKCRISPRRKCERRKRNKKNSLASQQTGFHGNLSMEPAATGRRRVDLTYLEVRLASGSRRSHKEIMKKS
jgi:hypothetical protein